MLSRFVDILAYFTSNWAGLLGSWFDPSDLEVGIDPDIDLHPRNCSPGCNR